MTSIRRSVMTLYSSDNIHSHRVRFVLSEKAVPTDIITVDPQNPPHELLELNPYVDTMLPTLTDRDLVLYKSNIIMEYLDERFPHPPLLAVYPVARAKSRLMMYRIEHDWYSLVQRIETGAKKEADLARKELMESLTSLAPVFGNLPFFLSEEFSLIDCCIVPLLWRLPALGIELPARAKPILNYAKRMFRRDAFQACLTESERDAIAV